MFPQLFSCSWNRKQQLTATDYHQWLQQGEKQILSVEAQHRHQVVDFMNTHTHTRRSKHALIYSHILPGPIMLFQTGEISWHLSRRVRLCVLMTRLAAMTGIHGVSSSEWFPISQSAPGNKKLSLGVIAFSWNSKEPKKAPQSKEDLHRHDLILNHLTEIGRKGFFFF